MKEILLALLFFIFIAGCIGIFAKNCGADESCFVNSLRNCEPVKFEFYNPLIGWNYYSEVQGYYDGGCLLYKRVKEGNNIIHENTCVTYDLEQTVDAFPTLKGAFCYGVRPRENSQVQGLSNTTRSTEAQILADCSTGIYTCKKQVCTSDTPPRICECDPAEIETWQKRCGFRK